MEIIYNTDDVLLMLQAQREQIEKRITPEMELDERKKYIHEIEEINKQIRKRKKELLHIQRWEALEDIKVGRCKIKKNQTVQIIDEGRQIPSGIPVYIITDGKRKYEVYKKMFETKFQIKKEV